MKNSLLVIDDFLPAAEAISLREYALGLDYSPKERDGHTYKGVSLGDGFVSNVLYGHLARAIGSEIDPRLSFFRVSKEGEETPHWIHVDNGEAQWAAVLYLTEESWDGDGTQFWRERETCASTIPASICKEYADRLNAKANDESAFSKTDFVNGEFNRIAIYPTRRLHSRYPRISQGNSNETGRLIWACFFDIKP